VGAIARGVFDVVVIGAGHNGLVAANYLADAGFDVLVVEANADVGGRASFGCAIPGAPHHVVNHCAIDAIFWDLFRPARDLQLDRFGLRQVPLDPCAVYLAPDGSSIAFWADPRRTADEICRFSADDAEAYLDFVELLRGFSDLAVAMSVVNPASPELRPLAGFANPIRRHRRRPARHCSPIHRFGRRSHRRTLPPSRPP
jgi:phytoene dehydrogenase-like protein